MTEQTVRRRPISRRTMLVAPTGMLGGMLLASGPAHAQGAFVPIAAVPGSSPPGSRHGDPA
jgi:hypothetical protein